MRASRVNPASSASASTGSVGVIANGSRLDLGASSRCTHCISGAASSAGSSAAISCANCASSASNAARARASSSAGVSRPCARSHAKTSAHSCGWRCGMLQRASASLLSPLVSEVASRPASRSQISCGSLTSAECGRNRSQRRRCARLSNHWCRSACATGCPAWPRKKASMAASSASLGAAPRSAPQPRRDQIIEDRIIPEHGRVRRLRKSRPHPLHGLDERSCDCRWRGRAVEGRLLGRRGSSGRHACGEEREECGQESRHAAILMRTAAGFCKNI